MNTPQDIYDHVVRSGKEAEFLTAVQLHKQNWSIAEIPDAVFSTDDGCRLHSKLYRLDLAISDEQIAAAAAAGQCITAFLARHEDLYQLHFLVHPWPAAERQQHEEEIVREVVRYTILKTIVALRLTTWKKVDMYLG